jgi:hypothetical protein
MADLTVPIQAARFLHDHGNVGRNADELLTTAPTVAQLQEAVDYAKREAEVAKRTLMVYHHLGPED